MRAIVVVLAAAAALAVVGPAAAAEDHASCKSFGTGGAALAQEQGGLGDLVRELVAGGAGAVAAQVAAEHAQFCAPRQAGGG